MQDAGTSSGVLVEHVKEVPLEADKLALVKPDRVERLEELLNVPHGAP